MGTKKKETKLKDLINIIEASNEQVLQNSVKLVPVESTYYIKIKHPFIKNKNVFVRNYELFVLYNLLIEIDKMILEKGILDEELKNKINDFIIMIKLVDSHNDIDKMYNYTIKNKTLYIL